MPHSLVGHPFPRSARILKSAHFRNVFKSGKRFTGAWIIMNYRLGRSSRPRLGITVSKKYGKAHDRNRFKRVVREAFRELYTQLPPSFEVNITPRQFSSEMCKKIILNDILRFLDS